MENGIALKNIRKSLPLILQLGGCTFALPGSQGADGSAFHVTNERLAETIGIHGWGRNKPLKL